MSHLHSKKTRKKETKLKKIKKDLKKTMKTAEEFEKIQSHNAIHMLHDPQRFAEKLFAKLRNNQERFNELYLNHTNMSRFEVRIMILDVISRCISVHNLILLDFYPFVQKYLEPHQLRMIQPCRT